MNFRPQIVKRKFEVDLTRLGWLEPVVAEVLDQMEKQTVRVYRPDDEAAFCMLLEGDGASVLHERATLSVNIPEWLCVACQRIRLGYAEDSPPETVPSGAAGWYDHNARRVLFPSDCLQEPVGPAGLDAEIVLLGETLEHLARCRNGWDQVRFVVAHELVHVFEAMRFFVPAVMNWKVFWDKALHCGTLLDVVFKMLSLHHRFLDDYGSQRELAMLEEYWPSRAGRWFQALRGSQRVSGRGRAASRRPRRSSTASGGGDREYPCPIPRCTHVFRGSRGGWDQHVAAVHRHPGWHPEIRDAEARKAAFRAEFPGWF
jgi:hypothetical protein